MATEGSARENLYRVLGLEPRASRAQIERAYRFHVELYGEDTLVSSTLLGPTEAEQQRHRVREAYDVLSDPERRRAYDERQGFPPPDSPSPALPDSGAGTPPPEPGPASTPADGDRDAPLTFAEPALASADIGEPRLATLLAPASSSFEALRVLRTKVHALDAERPARCLGLVSATTQEGTSAVAVGLAAALV
jgi:curved DNA-binding protein CbpA